MDVVLVHGKLTALMGEAIKQSHSMRSDERKAQDVCENQRSWFWLAIALKRRHFCWELRVSGTQPGKGEGMKTV